MKRAIITMELPSRMQKMALNIQDPGVIRGFAMGLRPRSVVSAIEMPGLKPGQQMMEEIPVLLVEVDPDAPTRRRYLAVVATDEVLEAEGEFVYRATAGSRAGVAFHIFEGLDVKEDETPSPPDPDVS